MTTMMTLADLLPISEEAADWAVAACRGDLQPDRWFPDPREAFDYATEICARCPIVIACGAYAADTAQTGVWGGYDYRQGKIVR